MDITDMDSLYFKKYLKYKNKYLRLSQTGGTNKKTYLIDIRKESLDYTGLKNLLKDWEEVTKEEAIRRKYVDFIFIDIITRELYNVNCKLKNILDDGRFVISQKDQLYFNMLKHYPDITNKNMMKTTNLKDVHNIEKNQILIARPSQKYLGEGKDVRVVTNNDELINAQKELYQIYDHVILSDYITNPLLFEGKKFHIRSYMIAVVYPYSYHLCGIGRIVTAKKPYINDDWNNKEIHDTHLKSTDRYLYFPNDLDVSEKNKKSILDQMEEIIYCLGEILRPHAHPYPECKNAYSLFGLDFMITSDYIVKLLEVNGDAVGFGRIGARGTIDESFVNFSNTLFKEIYKYAIDPIFNKTHD